MATSGRPENPGLDRSAIERLLRDDCCSFEFFQAVALLQRGCSDERTIGRFSDPTDEAVHFRSNNSLSFPASSIQEIEWPDAGPPQMTVNFMGLTGVQGVLPYCYTELLLERIKAKDSTLRSFLDIFNHRLISFFHRAWEKYRFPATYSPEDVGFFTQHLLDLVGMGTVGLQDRQSVDDEALLHFTGLLANQARSASALEHILSAYFEVPVEVEQFIGAWHRIDAPTQCSFTVDDNDSRMLGGGAVVGDEIWDQQASACIKLGPLTLEQYRSFLPDGHAFQPLRAIARFFSNDEFDFQVQLILKRDDVPECDLSGEPSELPRLGWVTWLKTTSFSRDPGDTILNL